MTHIGDKSLTPVVPPIVDDPKLGLGDAGPAKKTSLLPGFGDAFELTSPLLRFGRLAEATMPRNPDTVWPLDPRSADFNRFMARKYDSQTFEVWQAVANVLAAFLAQMLANMIMQILSGGGAGGSGGNSGGGGNGGSGGTGGTIPDTTPTATDGYTPMRLQHTELFDENGPTADDVQQGNLGDYYFLSALGGVATEDPELIKRNIKPHIDPNTGQPVEGQFDVCFYEKDEHGRTVEHWVTVNDTMLRDDKGYEDYAQTTDNDHDGKWEDWVAIYEKGYAVFQSETGDVDEGYDDIGQGGWGGEAYFALTGKEATADDPTNMDQQDLLDILSRTNPTDGDVVMLGSIGGDDALLRAQGLPGNHMYQVLGTYTNPNSGETMVTIRNPWGSFEPGVHPDGKGGFTYTAEFDGTNDGIFSIPLSQVQRDFDLITYPEDTQYDLGRVRYQEIRS